MAAQFCCCQSLLLTQPCLSRVQHYPLPSTNALVVIQHNPCYIHRQTLQPAVVRQQLRTTCHDSAQPAAAAAPEPSPSDAELDPEEQLASLPRPSQYHQAQLSGKERAALRSQAETLAKTKSLQRVQVGSKGVTLNVLLTVMDILMKHEYVRVKLGEGCGLERKQTAEQLAQQLDAAVVSQVGFTITLYRQKGLPRPDSLEKPQAPAAAA